MLTIQNLKIMNCFNLYYQTVFKYLGAFTIRTDSSVHTDAACTDGFACIGTACSETACIGPAAQIKAACTYPTASIGVACVHTPCIDTTAYIDVARTDSAACIDSTCIDAAGGDTTANSEWGRRQTQGKFLEGEKKKIWHTDYLQNSHILEILSYTANVTELIPKWRASYWQAGLIPL